MILGNLHKKYIHQHRVDVLAKHIITLLPRNSKVLDVGSGDGLLSYYLTQKRSDINCIGIDVLKRDKYFIPTMQYDGREMPLDDNSCDVVMFIDVIHHVENQLELLHEAYRVSKNYVIVKDHLLHGCYSRFLLRAMDWAGNHRYGVFLPYNYLPKDTWLEIIEKSNLRILSWDEKLVIYPFPLTYIFDSNLHFMTLLKKI